ncbi:MAG: hypothetical protein OXI96_11050 [Acidimicrobiaceae bacterium]|nr:hypothetical protein [Acidimicrobiaceae bacterium]
MRHRLNRGGNHRINKANHTAALKQISHPATEDRTYQKDYRQEAADIEGIVTCLKKTTGQRLLDVACDTGGCSVHRVNRSAVTGLDESESQLGLARQKLLTMEFVHTWRSS